MSRLYTSFADLLDPPDNPYAGDPVRWVTEKLGEELWSKQREIMGALTQHRRVAVRSCHDVGKSFTAARLAAYWLDTHKPGDAFVVTTAPTFPQVRAILWREIGRAHRKGNLEGRVNQTEWWIGNEMVAFGRKPSDYDEAAFQGIHARYVLVLIDEGCGVPEALYTAAGALVTNDDSHIVVIGNPDDPTSHFAKICQPGSGWHVIGISAHDSPNFTGESVSDDLRQVLVSQAYLDDLTADGCGPGTSVWSSKVLGEFPEESEDSVVSPSAVAKCRLPDQPHAPEDLLPVELGVDVGAGGDMSVIMGRRGPVAFLVSQRKTPDTMTLVGMVLDAIASTGALRVKVDKTGVGQGVCDRLVELKNEGKHTATIVGVMVGAASSKPTRFPKLRDELWWDVARLMSEHGRWDLSQLDDAVAAQLTAPKWAPDSSGRIKVEKKDDTKKRLGRSPDLADALILAFATLVTSGQEWLDSLVVHCTECGEVAVPGSAKCPNGHDISALRPSSPESATPEEAAALEFGRNDDGSFKLPF